MNKNSQYKNIFEPVVKFSVPDSNITPIEEDLQEMKISNPSNSTKKIYSGQKLLAKLSKAKYKIKN